MGPLRIICMNYEKNDFNDFHETVLLPHEIKVPFSNSAPPETKIACFWVFWHKARGGQWISEIGFL